MTLIAEGMIRGIAALQSARAVAPTRATERRRPAPFSKTANVYCRLLTDSAFFLFFFLSLSLSLSFYARETLSAGFGHATILLATTRNRKSALRGISPDPFDPSSIRLGRLINARIIY